MTDDQDLVHRHLRVNPTEELATVRKRASRLRASPEAADLFGFFGHGFEFGPPLPEDELEELERGWRVRLPSDYRYFVTRVGNGGAGPGYGLFPIGRWGDSAADNDPWDEWVVSDLAAPFPLTEAWNLPDAELQAPDVKGEALHRWYDNRDAKYFDPALIQGTIPIGHLGCAIWLRLVVAGPLAGQVWTDDRANVGGLRPASPSGFAPWYLAWLKQCETDTNLPAD